MNQLSSFPFWDLFDQHYQCLNQKLDRDLIHSVFIYFMSEGKQLNSSLTKQKRWNAREYLNFTLYKPSKTFHQISGHSSELADPLRRTEAVIRARHVREVSENKGGYDREVSIKRRRKVSGNKGHVLQFENSPYLSFSNATEIEKMLRILVPVQGPTQSVKQQIKRHNNLNFRNAQLLIVKKSQKFEDRMVAFSNRMDLPENSKIYTMNSRDRHIKQALTRRGWIESSEKNSVLFHLKWVYKDNLNDYQMLQQGQFYNHFKNNQELTNKNYLRKNIKKIEIYLRPNSPLAYDIDLNDDNTRFHQEFIKFEAFKLLDKIGKYFSVKQKVLYSKMKSNLLHFCNYNTKGSQLTTKRASNILYNLPQKHLKQQKIWDTLSNFFEYIAHIAEIISEEKKITYSIFKAKREIRQSITAMKKVEEAISYGTQQIFSFLSPFYITEILKLWHHSQDLCSSYGYENMWIVKPTGVSRGSGITITNDMAKISQLRYGKIVQKYIENPLLLECKRKFDIRQWVLVTKFQPLTAYAFKNCYGRFSSTKYTNDKYQNLQKHLTNYSQNKESYLRQKLVLRDNLSKNNQNMLSAMPQQELSIKIGQRWGEIKQKMYIDIIKTLNCCKSDIIQKEGCFQVYGFDVLIDQNYSPYILEVNMSPACEEREFLHDYLEQMAEGIVNMVEGGPPINWIQLIEEDLMNRAKEIKERDIKLRLIQNWWRNKFLVLKSRRKR